MVVIPCNLISAEIGGGGFTVSAVGLGGFNPKLLRTTMALYGPAVDEIAVALEPRRQIRKKGQNQS